ncbi:MAG: hypothetical protein M3483_08615, partial [Gemmatimonadota bacterium]|nr:hypothetical protein [Gemmatimonadota bacterium]
MSTSASASRAALPARLRAFRVLLVSLSVLLLPACGGGDDDRASAGNGAVYTSEEPRVIRWSGGEKGGA